MTWVIKLFLLTLKIYPPLFRAQFAEEMEEVFRAGLKEAREQGVVVSFVLREILRLPASLVGVYVWSMRAGEGKQMAVSGVDGGGSIGVPTPGEGWGASLLAGLPHLLIGIFIVSGTLFGELKGIDQKVFGYTQVAVYSLLLLGVLLFSIYKGWKRWSASWMTYIFIFAVSLLSLAGNALAPSITGGNNWVFGVQVIAIPLALAYLLYKIACIDRLRGLLAAVPPMALIWLYFQEFVPTLQRTFASAWMFMLAFTATVMILRTKRFTAALGLAMTIPVLGGLPFAYLGVYMGGTLPFSEPGPSLQEVFRQYLPFLAMVLALVLGPQLAVKLRTVGRESSNAGGKIFYRLVLGGLLLGLVFTILQWADVSSGMYILRTVKQVGLIAAIILYLVGFTLLVWASLRSEALSGDNALVLRLAALFILLPCVPIVIFLAIPNGIIGNNPQGWLFSVAEIVWVLVAAWWVGKN
jgi:hypothetical protein